MTQLSLRKQRTALIENVKADISVSNLQKILTSEARSSQAVRMCKDEDTDFGSKKRIDGLAGKSNPPVVLSFD